MYIYGVFDKWICFESEGKAPVILQWKCYPSTWTKSLVFLLGSSLWPSLKWGPPFGLWEWYLPGIRIWSIVENQDILVFVCVYILSPHKTLCTMRVRTMSVTSPWVTLPPEQWFVCKVCIIGWCYYSARCSWGLQGNKHTLHALRWCFTSTRLRIRAVTCSFFFLIQV